MIEETALPALNVYLEHQTRINRAIRKVYLAIRRGKLKIFVFGAGGTGKTTLARLLHDPTKKYKDLRQYSQSFDTERLSIDGDRVADTVVAPGQERHREKWAKLLAEMTHVNPKAKIGLIHVCAFGYHSVSVDWDAVPVVTGNEGESKFETYVRMCRADELAAIDYLAEHMQALRAPVSMATLVTKQDLWWDKRDAVRKFYIDGAYDVGVRRLRERLGVANIGHEYLFMSSMIANLCDKSGAHTMAKNCQGYDQILQTASFDDFLRFLHTIID